MDFAALFQRADSTTSDNGSSSTAALPKLSTSTSTAGASSSVTYSIPTVTVPSMENNPYMAKSNAPEGLVFIAVGSVLGALILLFFAMALYQRYQNSKKREGFMTLAGSDDRTLLYPGDPSRRDLPDFAATEKANPIPGSANSLFFSPTAEVMNSGGAGSLYSGSLMGSHNRSSSYLPYAASTSPSMTSRVRQSMVQRDSMYAPSMRNSMLSVSSPTGASNPGTQSGQSQQRPPSAYLDDLLNDPQH